MRRYAIQFVVAETIRNSLPKGFTLRGVARHDRYKAAIWARVPAGIDAGWDCNGYRNGRVHNFKSHSASAVNPAAKKSHYQDASASTSPSPEASKGSKNGQNN
jgi:hypothetical protein